jgi:broad specificity phosphatase PhoE
MASTIRRVLALLRHGEYAQPPGMPSAHLPYALTEQGRARALAAARALLDYAQSQSLSIDSAIDCSRMRRAWETAQGISLELNELTGLEFCPREVEALAERGLGAAANLTTEAIEAILADDPRFAVPGPGWKRDSAYRLPFQGAESLDEAGARVARHLLDCARDGAGRSLKVLVGHGGAFRHAAQRLGILAREQLASLTMQHALPIYLEAHAEEGGMVRLVQIGGQWPRRDKTAALD